MKKSGSILLALSAILICQALPALAQSSAKGMFFEQLDAPRESINTGLKYWIQMRRDKKLSLVDNRIDFMAGDEIRFQIVPNITGYAYVVLQKGTTGQKKVLFPNSYEPNGKVLAGRQYLLPTRGYLDVDAMPGTEIIRIVLSRRPLSQAALLKEEPSNTMKIAKGISGAEPIQNENCLVAFSQAETKQVDFAEEKGKTEGKGAQEDFSKDLNYVPGAPTKKRSSKSRVRRAVHRRPLASHKITPQQQRQQQPAANRAGSVTVINIEPSEKLVAEIQLNHI
ncbi:MAG: DUF4384 domain-containing protein [Candidatus Obscuribacterales bacterium]